MNLFKAIIFICFILYSSSLSYDSKISIGGYVNHNFLYTSKAEVSVERNEFYIGTDNSHFLIFDAKTGFLKNLVQHDTTPADYIFGNTHDIEVLENKNAYILSNLEVHNLTTHELLYTFTTPFIGNYEFGYNKTADKICALHARVDFGLPPQGTYYNTLYLFDYTTHSVDSVPYTGEVSSFACAEDSDEVFFTNEYGQILSYNFQSKKINSYGDKILHNTMKIHVSDDGTKLFFRDRSWTNVFVFDLKTNQITDSIQTNSLLKVKDIAMSPDNKYLVCKRHGGFIVQNLETDNMKSIAVNGEADIFTFIDNTRVIVEDSNGNGHIYIVDIVDNSIWPVVTTQMFYGSGLVSENSIISISSEYSLHNVTCKDIKSGKLLWEFKSDKYPQYYKPYTIELTRDEKYVVLSNLSKYIHILDLSSGAIIAEINIFQLGSQYYDVCILSDNSILISVSNKLIKYDIVADKFETIIEFPENTYCLRLFGGYDRIRGNCEKLNEEMRLERSFVIKIDALEKNYEEIGNLTYGTGLDVQHFRYSDSKEAFIYSDRSSVSENQGVFVDDFDDSKAYSFDKSIDLNSYEFLTDSTALVTTNKGLEVYNFVTSEFERVIKFPKIIIKNTFGSLDYNGNQYLKKQQDGRFLLTNQDGCLYVFDLIQTSIEEPIVFESSDKLYPNPVSNNTITIEHDNEIPELNWISICDISGRDITNFTFNHTGKVTEIYLNELPAGTYFISYAAQGSLYSHKFVVE